MHGMMRSMSRNRVGALNREFTGDGRSPDLLEEVVRLMMPPWVYEPSAPAGVQTSVPL